LKIAFLLDNIHSFSAGSERQIYNLVTGLLENGDDVTLYLLRATPFSVQLIKESSFKIVTLNISKIASLNTFQTMFKVKKRLTADSFQVIHAFFPDSCLLAPLFLKTSNNQVITSRRDMGLIYNSIPCWLLRIVNVRADFIVSNSKSVAKKAIACESIPERKSYVIYNGISELPTDAPPQQELFNNKDSIKLIIVANVKPIKRIHDLLFAFTKLTRDMSFELAIIGEPQDSTYCEYLNTILDQYKLHDKVRFHGSLLEPRQYLSQADIGLLVSESEGLSNSLLEYMLAGLAIIATDVGGNSELVFDGTNGLLIPMGNKDKLTEAIETLARNEDLRKNFGNVSVNLAEEGFSEESMLNQYRRLYEREE